MKSDGRTASPPASGPARRSRWRSLLLGLAVALVLASLLWLIAKEAIEPHWTVRLRALLVPGAPPATLSLAEGLTLAAYEDARPHVGKIARIQKGLVLIQDGRELIEEGYGFGAPIVVSGGRPYLSRTAAVSAADGGRQIVKRFVIDTEDTWTELFRRKYREVEPLGTVVFTYTVSAPGQVDIAADFAELRVAPELVYLTNEQGARSFTLYTDSAGESRYFADVPDSPDKWVPVAASRTCWTSEARALRFCVETPEVQAKFAGRERYFQWRWSGIFSLSWAGVDIELAHPPAVYRYRVTVEHLP